MVILGVDPGTAITGVGIVKTSPTLRHVFHGTITTTKGLPSHERLLALDLGLERLLKQHKPRFMAVERLYFFKNAKTALPVSEARGIVLLRAAHHGLKVIELTPLQIKMAITGYGRAQKSQVQRMVQQILGMKTLPRPDDAADALGAAIAASLLTRRGK